ncbi:UNVERIFIED_CONTAM: hypothetical protein GTU68_052123 [Idotea baltica]|nr:hypothetical protein [Idotea baltica]
MRLKHLIIIVLLALTYACSSDKDKIIDENLSEAQLYQKAQKDLDIEKYENAITKLKALESRYPFGPYAKQAQLELIYAHYENDELQAANAAADRFIRLHPEHPNIDYAYYLKGLASFTRDTGIIARFVPLDLTKRDPGAARGSYNQFALLIRRYPGSIYAPDAKQRMIYLRNLLASSEINVANYYLTRHAYVASANRARYVVENYEGTPLVGDALAIMVESYQNLTLNKLAQTSLETLKLNYPDNSNLKNGKFVPKEKIEDQRSWLSSATLGLIESDAPPPPKESQAELDLQRQYNEAEDKIPEDITNDIK